MRMSLPLRVVLLLVSVLCVSAASGPAFAQGDGAKAVTEDLLSSVVRIKTYINPDGRTVDNLGQERDGSGIVIDDEGLILTIGYLMVEAHAAEAITNDGRKIPATVIGYDHDTGFGLLKAVAPLKVRPMLFGKSSDLKVGDPVLAASFGGRDGIAPARVVSLREFAGSWEYLIDGAIYTAPAHSHWSGAALITRDGKLVGVGSLIVGDASGIRRRRRQSLRADRYPETHPRRSDRQRRGWRRAQALDRAEHASDRLRPGDRARHPEFSGREGRTAEGRSDHQYRRRYAEDAAGLLPQALVAGRRRSHRAARHSARRQGSAHQRAID